MRARSPLLCFALCFAFVPAAGAERRGKAKPKPATEADIERLERKVEAQQQVLDRIVRAQQQYAQAMSGLADGTAPPPSAPAPAAVVAVDKPADMPVVDKVAPAPEKPDPKLIAKPKPQGFGTVVGKVVGAADAVIYIEDIVVPGRGMATMKQEGKQFLPKVLVVQKGTTVDFPNRDAIFHNVFSVSPENTFDLGSYRQGETKSVKMSRTGVVTVYCNMHPQMVGHILVVPSGNYARAGADGFFRLANIPAGPHRVVAWAPNAKPVRLDANVVDGQILTLELSLKKTGSTAHVKKDGMPYGSYEQ